MSRWRPIHSVISTHMQRDSEGFNFLNMMEGARFKRFLISDPVALMYFFDAYERDRTETSDGFAEATPADEPSMLVMDYDTSEAGCSTPRDLFDDEFVLDLVEKVRGYLVRAVRLAVPCQLSSGSVCVPDCVVLRKPPYIAACGRLKHGFHLQFPKVFLLPIGKMAVHSEFPMFDKAASRNPWLLYGACKNKTAASYAVQYVVTDSDRRWSAPEYFSLCYVVTDTQQMLLVSPSDVERNLTKFLSIRELGCEFNRRHYKCTIPGLDAPSVSSGTTLRSRSSEEDREDGDGDGDGGHIDDSEPIEPTVRKRITGNVMRDLRAGFGMVVFPRDSATRLDRGKGFLHARRIRKSPCPVDPTHIHTNRPVMFRVLFDSPRWPVYVGCACGRKTPRGRSMVPSGTFGLPLDQRPSASPMSSMRAL